MAKLKAHLQDDIEDEQEAITSYAQRIREAKKPGLKKALRHIKGEEQQHKATLQKHLGAPVALRIRGKR